MPRFGLPAFAVPLAQFAAEAMKNRPRQFVSIFMTVQLDQRSTALVLIVDKRESAHSFVNAAEFGYRLCELGWPIRDLKRPHDGCDAQHR